MEFVYTVAFVVGLGYGLISVLLHGFADFAHSAADVAGSHDLHIEHDATGDTAAHVEAHGMDPSPVNSLTVAAFLLGFGAMGLIGTNGLGLGLLAGLAFAIGGAFLVAFVFFVGVLRSLYRFQGNSLARGTDILNASGEIVTSIPAGGTGSITVFAGGSRIQLPARTRDGLPVKQGTRVVMLEVRDGVAYVAPISTDGSIGLPETGRMGDNPKA